MDNPIFDRRLADYPEFRIMDIESGIKAMLVCLAS